MKTHSTKHERSVDIILKAQGGTMPLLFMEAVRLGTLNRVIVGVSGDGKAGLDAMDKRAVVQVMAPIKVSDLQQEYPKKSLDSAEERSTRLISCMITETSERRRLAIQTAHETLIRCLT